MPSELDPASEPSSDPASAEVQPPPVDPVELVAALLRRRGGARSCVDRVTGDVHRPVDECDPDEDDHRLDDAGRFLAIEPLSADEIRAFWDRAGFTEPASGLYEPLARLQGEARTRLLTEVAALASRWLEARGLGARLRPRE